MFSFKKKDCVFLENHLMGEKIVWLCKGLFFSFPLNGVANDSERKRVHKRNNSSLHPGVMDLR